MSEVSLAIIKLAFITLFGYCLYKRKIVTDEILQFLMFFVVNFSVPFLIFSHLIEQAEIVLTYPIWIFLLLSVFIFFVGYCLGFLISLGTRPALRREFIALVSLQNAGYLPMNLVFFLLVVWVSF